MRTRKLPLPSSQVNCWMTRKLAIVPLRQPAIMPPTTSTVPLGHNPSPVAVKVPVPSPRVDGDQGDIRRPTRRRDGCRDEPDQKRPRRKSRTPRSSCPNGSPMRSLAWPDHAADPGGALTHDGLSVRDLVLGPRVERVVHREFQFELALVSDPQEGETVGDG